jgi:hypothetical protein
MAVAASDYGIIASIAALFSPWFSKDEALSGVLEVV